MTIPLPHIVLLFLDWSPSKLGDRWQKCEGSKFWKIQNSMKCIKSKANFVHDLNIVFKFGNFKISGHRDQQSVLKFWKFMWSTKWCGILFIIWTGNNLAKLIRIIYTKNFTHSFTKQELLIWFYVTLIVFRLKQWAISAAQGAY